MMLVRNIQADNASTGRTRASAMPVSIESQRIHLHPARRAARVLKGDVCTAEPEGFVMLLASAHCKDSIHIITARAHYGALFWSLLAPVSTRSVPAECRDRASCFSLSARILHV